MGAINRDLACFLGLSEKEEIILGRAEDLRLYLVEEGEVSPATPDTEWDGEQSLLVAATSEQEALLVAKAYDASLLGVDNICWHGQTIAAVMFWNCYN